MRRFCAFVGRLAAVFGRQRRDRDLEEEIESNLQFHIDDNLRAGMTPEEARRQALIRLGGVEQTKERCRDQRGLPSLEAFLQDTRYSLRMLRKAPGFTAVALLTLAIGIGATTALFSVINSVLLRPLNYPGAERLYVINEIIPQWASSSPRLDANLPDFLIWRKQAASFEDVALAEGGSMILSGVGEATQVRITRGSANFLEMLGVHPALGRSFRPEEDRSGHGYSVILTDSIWRSRFGSDPSIVGRAATLDGAPYTVVGVLPPTFHMPGMVNGFSTRAQMFVPLNGPKDYEQGLIGEFDFTAIGRLKPGITPTQALAELNAIQAAIAREAKANVDLRAALSPLQDEIAGSARRGLLLLLGAVGSVLLMICVNIANLLLARVPGRLRDAGIRKALGATRARLFRQPLVESLLLASVAGVLGILLADYGVRAFAYYGPVDIPRLSEAHVDGRALLFTLLACGLTAALIGAVPAWLVSRADLNATLSSAGKSTTHGRGARSLQGVLIGVEIATCTVLLILAGLLGRSLLKLLNLDPGFRTHHVLTASVDLPPVSYKDPAARNEFYRRVLDEIRGLPGVRSAGWISILPLQGQGSVSGMNLPGNTLAPEDAPIVNYRVVSPGYFATMGIPLLSGRAIDEQDQGQRHLVVSQALARRLWPHQDAVGQHCIGKWGYLQLDQSEVAGVAGDVRTRLDQPPLYIVYVANSWASTEASAPMSASFVVQTTQEPMSVAVAARAVIHRAGPDVPIVALRPMSVLVSLSVEGRRFQMLLTASFAVSALLLSALGIYGVLAYWVEQRRREFGIRTALGATRPQLLRMVIGQGLWPVSLGLLVGILAAMLGGSLLRGLVFGVTSQDPLTFFAVGSVIAVVSIASCYFPARRATRIVPTTALRYE